MTDGTVQKIRLSRGVLRLWIRAAAPEAQGPASGTQAERTKLFLHPAGQSGPVYPFTYRESTGSRRQDACRLLRLDLKKLPLTRGDWECSMALPLDDRIRRSILLRGSSTVLPGTKLLAFPMAGDGSRLILRVRPRTAYDTARIWVKERFAFALASVLKRLGTGRTDRVIFEKFCAQAQDNGYAFFRYCMRKTPPERRRRIYYILDRHSAVWKDVKAAWGRQVVPFMSLKHMLLMQLAPLYIASESRYHGYLWQTRPNPVFRDIRRGSHRILFLQHGVTALKRVEGVFGKNGYNPMTWFAVTSPGEQRIVTRYLGYTEEEAPILGFVRWDELKDHSDPASPVILVMPTWRAWLENVDAQTFSASVYCRTYQKLLTDPGLLKLLEENHATLCFYIHPKLSEMLQAFSQNTGSLIRLIPYGSRNLSELIMECACLVTDYSSVCWDVCRLSKPTVFFQFDADRYLAETGSYLDFASELPGERAETIPELTALLKKTAAEGWQENPAALAAARRMLPAGDCENAERTAAFIISREGIL